MTELDDKKLNLYALLIGIDCYLPNHLCGNLWGCVRDISHVETFLKTTLHVQQERILKLTASHAIGKEEPSESPEQWPTYKNIVAKFQELTEMSQPGDYVYIHYSGHGGRAKTVYPQLKKEPFIDETLVPTDIGKPEGQHLRDIELATLLKRMVDKGLLVTVVLDSCHSGGATRGNDSDIRGTNVVDETPRLTESLVASAEELTDAWLFLTTTTRKLNSFWLPESGDYVLLAACRPTEVANEFAFNRETGERNGALTYWLLDSLNQLTSGITYKELYERINAKVNSQFPQQTPMLIGDGNRFVFGSEYAMVQQSVSVMKVDEFENRVLLETGQAMGVRQDAEFAIYSFNTRNFTQPQHRLAVAEVTELGSTQSWCKLQPIPGKEAVKQGDRAVPISTSVNLIKKVGLLYLGKVKSETQLPSELEVIKEALKGNGWVELASGKEAAHYLINVNQNGEYEICDGTGMPFTNIQPSIKVRDDNAAMTVVKRLVHLSKYHATQSLDNFDKNSPLLGKLEVELVGKQKYYNPVDLPNPEPFDDSKNASIKVGEKVFLRIKNIILLF